MAYSAGRCTNVDYCVTADARRIVEAVANDRFVCPECFKPLKPPAAKAPGVVAPMVMALSVLLASGGAVYMGLTRLHVLTTTQAALAHMLPVSSVVAAGTKPAPEAAHFVPVPAAPKPPARNGA